MAIDMSAGICLEASEVHPGDYLEGSMVTQCIYVYGNSAVRFILAAGMNRDSEIGPIALHSKLLVVLGKNNPLYHIRQEING